MKKKHVVLDVALAGKAAENRLGADWIFTRANDTFISTGDPDRHRQQGSGRSLPFHPRQFQSRVLLRGGVETYYLTPQPSPTIRRPDPSMYLPAKRLVSAILHAPIPSADLVNKIHFEGQDRYRASMPSRRAESRSNDTLEEGNPGLRDLRRLRKPSFVVLNRRQHALPSLGRNIIPHQLIGARSDTRTATLLSPAHRGVPSIADSAIHQRL